MRFWDSGYHYFGYRISSLPTRYVRRVFWGVPYYIVDNVYYRYYGGSYYVLDKEACLTLINECFNPCKEDRTAADLDIRAVS